VLSLREDDVFLQMTVISATLLRKTTPKCKIVILIDEHTELNKYPLEYQLLLDLQVEVVTIPTGYSNCVLSSRFIKLSLPYIINEKFWYLDADTLPIVSVVDPEVIWDIAMVRDLNMNRSHYLLGESRSNNCDVMGWPKPKYPYYNSGVIFANCNSRVKDLFDHAKDLWLSALERGVNCGDQLPLNIAMQNYTRLVACYWMILLMHRFGLVPRRRIPLRFFISFQTPSKSITTQFYIPWFLVCASSQH